MIRKYLSPKQFGDLDNKLNSNVDYVIVDNNSPKKVIFETNNITGDIQTYEFEAGAQTPLKMLGWSFDTVGTPVELWPTIANYTSYTHQNDTYTFDFFVQYNRALTEEEAIAEAAKFTLSGTSVEPVVTAQSGDSNNWLEVFIEEVPGEEVRSESVELNYEGDLVDILYPLYNQIINVAAVIDTPKNDKEIFFATVGNYQGIRTGSQLRPRITNTYMENDEVAINIMQELAPHSYMLNSVTLGFDPELPLDTYTCTLTNIGNNIYAIQGTVPKATGDINSTTFPNGFKFYINGIEIGTAIW